MLLRAHAAVAAAVGALLLAACSTSGDDWRAADGSLPGSSTSVTGSLVADPLEYAEDTLAVERVGTGRAGHPSMVAVRDGFAVRLRDGVVTPLFAIDGRAGSIVGDGSGSVVVELFDETHDEHEGEEEESEPVTMLATLSDGADPAPLDLGNIDGAFLFDLVRLGDKSKVLYSTASFPEDDEPSGDLLLATLSGGAESGSPVRLGASTGPEFSVGSGSIAANGLVVLSAYADLTETVYFTNAEGDEVDLPSPTDDLEYNDAPLIVEANLSADGTRVAHLEGPDVTSGEGELVGHWQLVVTDIGTGEELDRLALPWSQRRTARLDYDGRWAVISVAAFANDAPAPLVVDLTAADPVAEALDGLTGIVTLDG